MANLTLDKLTLDLGGGAFAEGQTYVALSRARTLDGITLAALAHDRPRPSSHWHDSPTASTGVLFIAG